MLAFYSQAMPVVYVELATTICSEYGSVRKQGVRDVLSSRVAGLEMDF